MTLWSQRPVEKNISALSVHAVDCWELLINPSVKSLSELGVLRGTSLERPACSVLVVDDHQPWRSYVFSTLQKHPELKMIGEASDGADAIEKVKALQPDLILLDIGLPTLNGIAAARRIREVSPASKILFVSENRSADIVEEALSTGAGGYVVKSDANAELLPAVKAVLDGKRFVSACVAGQFLVATTLSTTQTMFSWMALFISASR